MHTLFERKISIALPAMLAIQSFGTMCCYAGAVVAVQAAADLGVKSTSIGIYTAVIYATGMVSGLGTGSVLARYGVIRTCQAALLAGVLGLVLASIFPFWPLAIGAALLLGLGTGPLNPAGSRILARHTPPQWQPFVFSVKQTGTPLGGMLAGLLLPPLMLLYDWRAAVAVISLIPLVTLLCLQFIRDGLDDDRDPEFRIRLSGILTALRLILTGKRLVLLAVAGYFYTFAQMSVLTFVVIYLVEANGLSAEFAGAVFAIIHGSAIPARIIWGAIAGRLLSSWVLLGILGVVMACSILAISVFSPGWPFWLTALIAILLGASTNGVLGLLMSEFTRLAPEDKVGEVVGGAQFFLFFGIVSGPPVFGAVVEYSGGYDVAFYLIAAGTLTAGCLLLVIARAGHGQ
tara:strand:+ start:809 stop:2017 length:1209 start_codon:yes stop_codon:yes gene_type:complete